MAYIAGKGTTLKVSISTVFTIIAQLKNITPPGKKMGTTETTHLLSTDKEFISTIREGGDVKFTVEWDPANTTHAYLLTAFDAGTMESWKVTLPNGTIIAFTGILTDFPWDQLDVEAVAMIDLTIKVSGAVTVTP
jgi:hypothetical protein